MNVVIKPELERFIDDQVKAGHFASKDEAMEAGIARLMLDPAPDSLDEQDVTDIRASLEEIRQGKVISKDELHAQLRKKYLGK